MTLHRYDIGVRLEGLIRDAERAVAGWDWRRGAFGHALSLPAPSDLHPSSRYSYQNFPCTGLLAQCPSFHELFECFRCHKVSFRLLRREPASAYAWHTDRSKGPGVARFQIPIVSPADAFLVTTDYERPEEIRGVGRVLTAELFPRFADANAGHFEKHHLEPGRLHYFDTTRVHTLVNPGPGERITLSFDLVANAWLRERFPAILPEIAHQPARSLRSPGLPALALRWTASRFHPLRSRVHRWRQVGLGHRS